MACFARRLWLLCWALTTSFMLGTSAILPSWRPLLGSRLSPRFAETWIETPGPSRFPPRMSSKWAVSLYQPEPAAENDAVEADQPEPAQEAACG